MQMLYKHKIDVVEHRMKECVDKLIAHMEQFMELDKQLTDLQSRYTKYTKEESQDE